MAIYHLNIGHISRSTGRSSVQSAAYVTGEKLFESRRELKISYHNRQSDVVAHQTLAPDDCPEFCRDLAVWDRLESFEDDYAFKRYPRDEKSRDNYINTARTAMTVVVALPREFFSAERYQSIDKLSPDHVAVELVETFVRERFVSRGLIATYAIHNDEGNPHAHIQVSRRSVDGEGAFSWAKDRDICTRSGVKETRRLWADLTNRMLEREGFEERITEKSFVDLGIDLDPSSHRGWMADKLANQNIVSRLVVENEEVAFRNRERLIQNPEIILDELTVYKATLTQKDIVYGLQKRIGDDTKLVAQCFEQVLSKAVCLGEDINGLMRYTSPSYVKDENELLAVVQQMVGGSTRPSVPLCLQTEGGLSDEQRAVAEGLLKGQNFSVLVGRAGSGKTTLLQSVAQSYQEVGLTVVGVSLSALAADQLGREAKIPSYTVSSLLGRMERYEWASQKLSTIGEVVYAGKLKRLDWYRERERLEPFQLTNRHVMIIDEAGMLGTRQWKALVERAYQVGARVIAVGDDHQLSSIEAGSAFRGIRAICDQHQTAYELTTIYRQRDSWMRQASRHFADFETGDGMMLYENHGRVHQTDRVHMSQDVALRYMDVTDREGQRPLVLASTNQQVKDLNQAIRALRVSRGEIGKELFTIQNIPFALNDVVVMGRNDSTIGVYNGSRGVITGFSHNCVTVTLDGGKLVSFNSKEYSSVSYGYAVTLHKAQGQTVERVLVVSHPHMDAKALYVAMTRHRHDAELFYTKEDFKDVHVLANRLSRLEYRDLASERDGTIRLSNQPAFERVQKYRWCVLDGVSAIRQKDWDNYRIYRQDQIQLGRDILSDISNHRLYVQQAGLSENCLKIACGLKQRLPSTAEQRAQVTVELYQEVSKTLQASQAHALSWERIQELRAEKDSFARVINDNIPLHRPFLKKQGIRLKEVQVSPDTRRNTLQTPGVILKQSNDSAREFDHRGRSSSQEVISSLNDHVRELASQVLGEPTSKNAREWRWGRHGSLSVVVSGARQGLYSNFETGNSGYVVQLIADTYQMTRKEAFRWGAEWLEGKGLIQNGLRSSWQRVRLDPLEGVGKPSQEHKDSLVWRPIRPPQEAPKDLAQEPGLTGMLRGRREVGRYAYRDRNGELIGYVVRLEDSKGHKITPMLSYGSYGSNLDLDQIRDKSFSHSWRFKSFVEDGEKRPLYGLEEVVRTSRDVLVVEGEKTCEAARKIFPDYVVVTWSGGCGAVARTDWSALRDRNVILWPDHDEPGQQAMEKIKNILTEKGVRRMSCVDLPTILPAKWDLADPVPEMMHPGFNVRDLLEPPLRVQEQTGYEEPFSVGERRFEVSQRVLNDRLDEIKVSFNESACERVQRVYHKLVCLRLSQASSLEKEGALRGVYQDSFARDQAIYLVHRTDLLQKNRWDEQVMEAVARESYLFAEQEGRLSPLMVEQRVALEMFDERYPEVMQVGNYDRSSQQAIVSENRWAYSLLGYEIDKSMDYFIHDLKREFMSTQIHELDPMDPNLKLAIQEVMNDYHLQECLEPDEHQAYQDIQRFYDCFKEIDSEVPAQDHDNERALKRSAYALYYMRMHDQHDALLSKEERFWCMLIASDLFARTGNPDVHVKALEIVKEQERISREGVRVFEETFEIDLLRDRDYMKDNHFIQESLRDHWDSLLTNDQKEHESPDNNRDQHHNKRLER